MSESKQVILVTGGAGYIGSHAVLILLKKGYHIVVVDNHVNSKIAETINMPESLIRVENICGRKVDFHNIDTKKKQELSEVFDKYKVDCVIHLAALKAVGESCQIPLAYYSNNVTGAITLLEVMKEHGVFHMIYSSSSTVYGTPQFLPITEEHPTGLSCTNPYSKSKYFVEEILKDLCLTDKIWRVMSLRYFNPIGAHESGQLGEDPVGIPQNLMPFLAQVAVGCRPFLQINGNDYDTHDGTAMRDYTHVMDVVEAHINAVEKILNSNYSGFNAYNLGSGVGHSVLDVIRTFEAVSGHEVKYKFVPRRKGDIAASYCDNTKARRELQWTAKRNLTNMCEDVWRWQSKHLNGN